MTDKTGELVLAAICASNVLFLLQDEVDKLGFSAREVLPRLTAAITACTEAA